MTKKYRKYKDADTARKDRELRDQWARLLSKYPPRSTQERPAPPPDPYRRHTALESAPSVDTFRPAPAKVRPRYEGELQEREEKARAIIEDRKHMVAPVANKMGYQLITSPDDFKTMGRKI